MPIVSMGELLRDAQQRGYAVGGFDTWSLESVCAVVEAAVEERSPAIILTGPYGLGRTCESLERYIAFAKVVARKADVPIAILMNEARSFELVEHAVGCGFTGVMMEATDLPPVENAKITSRVVKLAHAAGISVEAQADVIPFEEDLKSPGTSSESFVTDPEAAREFVRQTGVDALSVIVGNVHALATGKVDVDVDRIARIRQRVDIPLVLHGGTGISDESLAKAIGQGVSKVNYGLALREGFLGGVRSALQQGPADESVARYLHVEEVLESGKAGMKAVVKEKMRACLSCGKA